MSVNASTADLYYKPTGRMIGSFIKTKRNATNFHAVLNKERRCQDYEEVLYDGH